MPGRSFAPIPWTLIFDIYTDRRVPPGDRTRLARDQGADRSLVQLDRYFAAADVVCRYHAGGKVDLRRVTPQVEASLQEFVHADTAAAYGTDSSPDSMRAEERIFSRISPWLLERAAAGWEQWEAFRATGAGTGPLTQTSLRRPVLTRLLHTRWLAAAGAALILVAMAAGYALAPIMNSLEILHVEVLPLWWMESPALSPGTGFVGHRFRVSGGDLSTVPRQRLRDHVHTPLGCEGLGLVNVTSAGFDLLVYCRQDLAPGQYRISLQMPDLRKASTTFIQPR